MTNIEKHKQICAELTDLYAAKNADYGDSFHKSFEKYGLDMAAIRLGDKFNRFERLSLGAESRVKTESIRDTLLDLANYAIMTVAEIDSIEEKQEETMERLTYWNKDMECWSYHGPSGEAAIRLAAYEDALSLERTQELAQAEKDGRMVVLQDGITVHDLQNEYCTARHMADERLPSPSYTTGHIAGFGEGAIHILDKILTREEAEAALKKREEEE